MFYGVDRCFKRKHAKYIHFSVAFLWLSHVLYQWSEDIICTADKTHLRSCSPNFFPSLIQYYVHLNHPLTVYTALKGLLISFLSCQMWTHASSRFWWLYLYLTKASAIVALKRQKVIIHPLGSTSSSGQIGGYAESLLQGSACKFGPGPIFF